jgi:hypothetical protein
MLGNVNRAEDEAPFVPLPRCRSCATRESKRLARAPDELFEEQANIRDTSIM